MDGLPPGALSVASLASAWAFLAALPPTRCPLILPAWVTGHAPPCLPATVSPSQSPVRLLDDASSGLSEMSWVTRTLPPRSRPPFPCPRFPWCLSSLAAFLCPGSPQSGDPDPTARWMAVMWQHLLEQIYERIRPASLNSTGLM